MRKMKKRYQWLASMIKHNNFSVGAEVGCASGNTTWRILKACPKLTLFCVDLWSYADPTIFSQYSQDIYKDWQFDKIKKEFDKNIKRYKSRVLIKRGVSWEVPTLMCKEFLEFVFIDADHAYESVVKDIKAWTPLLKKEGVLCGHDCNLPGVQQALNTLTRKWHDTGVDNVWFCRKEDVLCWD